MPFVKGKIANPQGRPVGAMDKVNAQIRDKFKVLVEDNIDQLREDLKELKPRERVDAIIRLANFILPRQRSIQLYEMPEVAELLLMSSEERLIELARLKSELEGNGQRG